MCDVGEGGTDLILFGPAEMECSPVDEENDQNSRGNVQNVGGASAAAWPLPDRDKLIAQPRCNRTRLDNPGTIVGCQMKISKPNSNG
jgi:hypothetical protein